MNKQIITIFQYLFFVGLGVFFIWLAIKEISPEDWKQIKGSLLRARMWLLIPVIVMLLGSHYSRAVRWKLLMEPLGYKPSTFNTWAAVMIGYLVNAGVPRLGELVRCTLLTKYEKVRTDKLVGTIVVERAVDVVCLLVVFMLALLFQGHIIGAYTMDLFGNFLNDKGGNLSFTKIGVTLFLIVSFILFSYFILKRFGHIDVVSKIKNIIKGIIHGLGSIRFLKHKSLFLLHTFIIWAMYLGSTTLGIYALQETAHLGLGGGLTTLAIGSIGMVITPNGIGAYPLLVAKMLGAYGLDYKTTGMALGWLLWTVQTLIVLIGGLIFSALFSYYNKKRKSIEGTQQYTEQIVS